MSESNLKKMATAILGALVLAGCGTSKGTIPTGTDGPVVFRDALKDNRNEWINDPRAPFRNGKWEWNAVPAQGAELTPGTLHQSSVPSAVSVSAYVVERSGAALRAVSCRDTGTTSYTGGYDLGVDGRRALIRRLAADSTPRVLAAKTLAVPDGRRILLVGRCVPDGKRGLALTLLVDGKVVAQALDPSPGPQGAPGLHAFARPDSSGPSDITWDTFVVRKAS